MGKGGGARGGIEVFLFVWGQMRHSVKTVTFKMFRTTVHYHETSDRCLKICLSTRRTVDMHNQGEVCGFRQPYETSSVCFSFCIYLHNLTVSLFMQLGV